MILKLLLNTQMMWMIFTKILKNAIQIRNVKHKLVLIWLLICFLMKKLNPIVTELIIRGKKLNISLVFIRQSYFAWPKNIGLNSKYYFVMEILNKGELQLIIQLIIHQILSFKTLWIFIKNVQQNHILFWGLILLLHQIILHVSERIY